MKRAFTIVELLVCIAIIAIIGCVSIPMISNAYDSAKSDIIEQYNGNGIRVIDIDTNEIIYEGEKEEFKENIELVDIKYKGGIVEMYCKRK